MSKNYKISRNSIRRRTGEKVKILSFKATASSVTNSVNGSTQVTAQMYTNRSVLQKTMYADSQKYNYVFVSLVLLLFGF